ncbi:MAG TPA: CAP domain-containing protein [Solirubrobacteraceae bacterium]|jgi:uncharacterized protein YkwD|nr:CAP domain-containing protein [Solirubrobacteraceae bacterium]
MRRIQLTFVVACLLASGALAASAQAGTRIGRLASCSNGYQFFGDGPGTVAGFRAGLLCLINEARQAEHLPPLKRSAQLERVAQAQSDKFARTGAASHGKSISDIAARFVKVGYHPAAYDEAFDVLTAGATPYGFVAHMLSKAGLPCSQILDPRFRDVGIGASVASAGFDTLAIELGLRSGQRQPSTRTGPASSCPHKPPAPLVTGPPIVPAGSGPAAHGSQVTLGVRCTAAAACVFTSTLTLPHAHASAAGGTVRVPAGRSSTITYTFTGSAVATELSSPEPSVSLAIAGTAPVPYAGTLTGPLQ